jgi:phenylacetate-CoA ligase
MISGQCERGKYHICAPMTFTEIVNGKGERVTRGETGRVVVTRLTPNPMPLIRYDVGDISALSREEECGCGRHLALMEPIDGRCSEIIKTPSGHKIPSLFFAYIMRMEQTVALYQVRQDARDRLTVKVVPGPGFGEEALKRIEMKLLEGCRHDVRIEFEIVDDIPPGRSGKRQFVVSTIPY